MMNRFDLQHGIYGRWYAPEGEFVKWDDVVDAVWELLGNCGIRMFREEVEELLMEY